ncbi:MAG: hypothetical protein RI953_3000 [Pseudomonadota bacterium]|jgi:hypothetical protein
MEKFRTFSRSAGLTALAVAGLSLALGQVLADDRPIPRPIPLPNQPGRPPILIDPAKLPVIRHSYIIKTLPVQVIKPIQTRLPSVPLPQLRPETQVTIGLYNGRGAVDGAVNKSLQQIQNEMNTWANDQRSQYQVFAGRSPIFSNMNLKELTQFNQAKNRNMRVGQIPMNLVHLEALKRQSDAFKNPGQVENEPEFKDRTVAYSGGYARSLGNEYFGVDANAGYGVNISKDYQKADANATVNGTILQSQVNVFDAQAHNETGQATYCYISVFGQKLWEMSSPSFSDDVYYDRSEGARMNFWLGPVPMSVGGTVTGRLGTQYNVQALYGEKLLNGTVRPYLDTYGNVDAAIDAYIASAGVFGSLKFLGLSLPTTAYLKYDLRPDAPLLTANLDVNTNVDALGGRVGLFAEIDYWLDTERWEKTLFSWSGFQESASIFKERESLPLKDYIGWKYKQLNGASGFLGQAVGAEFQTPTKPGLYRHFQGGSIYWSEATGAHEVHGLIRNKWASMGWENGSLGFPRTDEQTAPDSQGKYNIFEGGSLWYHPATGNAFLVKGAIYQKWSQLRRGMGLLGYPVTDETQTPDGRGYYNHFQNGSIYWTPQTGAAEVHGLIRQKWADNSWERGVLGYPLTDEGQTPDGLGRFNHFEGGSVYYHPEFGTHIVRGAIRDRWESLNWERGCLGYPKEEQRVTQTENVSIDIPIVGRVSGVRKTIAQGFEGGSVSFKEDCVGPQCKVSAAPTHQCNLIPIKVPPIVRIPLPTRPMPLPRPTPGPNSLVVDETLGE